MWALLATFGRYLVNLAMGPVALKFAAMFVLFIIVTELLSAAGSFAAAAGSAQGLDQAFYYLPRGMWWFMGAFRVDFGFPAIFSAVVAKFIIRRLPIVG